MLQEHLQRARDDSCALAQERFRLSARPVQRGNRAQANSAHDANGIGGIIDAPAFLNTTAEGIECFPVYARICLGQTGFVSRDKDVETFEDTSTTEPSLQITPRTRRHDRTGNAMLDRALHERARTVERIRPMGVELHQVPVKVVENSLRALAYAISLVENLARNFDWSRMQFVFLLACHRPGLQEQLAFSLGPRAKGVEKRAITVEQHSTDVIEVKHSVPPCYWRIISHCIRHVMLRRSVSD